MDTPEARRRQLEGVWVSQECWHELRWRLHRIRRRVLGLEAPEACQAVAARARLKAQAYLEAPPGLKDEEEATPPESAYEALFDLIEHHRKEMS